MQFSKQDYIYSPCDNLYGMVMDVLENKETVVVWSTGYTERIIPSVLKDYGMKLVAPDFMDDDVVDIVNAVYRDYMKRGAK